MNLERTLFPFRSSDVRGDIFMYVPAVERSFRGCEQSNAQWRVSIAVESSVAESLIGRRSFGWFGTSTSRQQAWACTDGEGPYRRSTVTALMTFGAHLRIYSS